MCILIVLRNRVDGWPLVVGANRDEYRDRPWEPPRRTEDVRAPRDLRAGGTWLALHDAGLLVAVTNRPDPDYDADRPSRGTLAMDLAATGDLRTARWLLEEDLRRERWNAFQVLVATAETAWVGIHPGPAGEWGEVIEVPDGLHHLTNLRGLDELDHRGSLDPLNLPAGSSLDDATAKMKAALATHPDAGPGDPDIICKHGEDRGTLSSSILALPDPASGLKPVWNFAPGAPCETDFTPVGENP